MKMLIHDDHADDGWWMMINDDGWWWMMMIDEWGWGRGKPLSENLVFFTFFLAFFKTLCKYKFGWWLLLYSVVCIRCSVRAQMEEYRVRVGAYINLYLSCVYVYQHAAWWLMMMMMMMLIHAYAWYAWQCWWWCGWPLHMQDDGDDDADERWWWWWWWWWCWWWMRMTMMNDDKRGWGWGKTFSLLFFGFFLEFFHFRFRSASDEGWGSWRGLHWCRKTLCKYKFRLCRLLYSLVCIYCFVCLDSSI